MVGNSHKGGIPGLLDERYSRAQDSFVPLGSLLSREPSSIDADLRSLGSVAPSQDFSPARSAPAILVGDISKQRQFVSAAHFGGAVEDRTRPNLKIQDGCNNRCSFCIIPSVRGLSRSLPVADVLSQIRALSAQGYREVVLSGVNLGQYGRDLDRKPRFINLIQQILAETAVERLRLSSVEPMDFTNRLLDLMASTPRIARHVHAPMQSGSDRILRLMHRKYRAAQYRQRILAAYDRMPNAAFGADVIAGFPGETEEDFEATRCLIEELPFTYLHVFPFSRRPDTPADRMKNQVHGSVMHQRGHILRELAAEKNRRFRERHIGSTMRLLTLGAAASGGTLALSDNYLKVVVAGASFPANQWVDVKIDSAADGCMSGQRTEIPAENQSPEERSPSMMTCARA